MAAPSAPCARQGKRRPPLLDHRTPRYDAAIGDVDNFILAGRSRRTNVVLFPGLDAGRPPVARDTDAAAMRIRTWYQDELAPAARVAVDMEGGIEWLWMHIAIDPMQPRNSIDRRILPYEYSAILCWPAGWTS
jgi:hypothetical protein